MILLRAIYDGIRYAFGLIKAGFNTLADSPGLFWGAFASLFTLSGSFFMTRAAELVFNRVFRGLVFASGASSVSSLVELSPLAAFIVDVAALDSLVRWLVQLLALWAAYRLALLGKMAITAVLHIIP